MPVSTWKALFTAFIFSSASGLPGLRSGWSRLGLLIIDELGFVPLSPTGADLLFEVFSQRYERGSILVTTNLPFDEWTGVFGSERLTGALLDSCRCRLSSRLSSRASSGPLYLVFTGADAPVRFPSQ